ncbi:MAG: transcriptional regulator [Acidimicrobiales bacterium]|nr:MAG: transcriptional regulator [Acidimicrobiales bacterium]
MNGDSKTSAVSWGELKEELFDVDDQRAIAAHAQVLRAQVRAYRLAEVRKRQHTTQVAVAHTMGVSQARVSEIERGHIIRSEVDTLAAYVGALGGNLRLVADFGDETITLA